MTGEGLPSLLYVEDEPLVLELGVTASEEAGFEVTALPTGSDAMVLLTERGRDFNGR